MRGWEGLYGRPRPVHLASMLGRNTITPHPAGDHKGPHRPTSAALAPTDVDAYLATARIAPPLHQQDTQSSRVRAGLAPALVHQASSRVRAGLAPALVAVCPIV